MFQRSALLTSLLFNIFIYSATKAGPATNVYSSRHVAISLRAEQTDLRGRPAFVDLSWQTVRRPFVADRS